MKKYMFWNNVESQKWGSRFYIHDNLFFLTYIEFCFLSGSKSDLFWAKTVQLNFQHVTNQIAALRNLGYGMLHSIASIESRL